MHKTINKILYWFGYVLSVITLCVGVMALLASLLLYEAKESWEIIIFWNIIGLICIFFPTLFFIRHKKKSPKEKSPFVQIEEQPSLNPKDKILSWLDYAWRIVLLIIAIISLLFATISFLISENSFGLICLFIGLFLLYPFARKKSNGNTSVVLMLCAIYGAYLLTTANKIGFYLVVGTNLIVAIISFVRFINFDSSEYGMFAGMATQQILKGVWSGLGQIVLLLLLMLLSRNGKNVYQLLWGQKQ